MKKIAKCILSSFMQIVSRVYTYNFNLRLNSYKDIIYTMWMKNFVGCFGEGSYIFYPCRFWGGGSNRISIGKNTTIHANCILGCWVKYAGEIFTPSIIIGNNCDIGEHSHISAINNIIIGDGLLTGRYVYIGDNSHGGLSRNEGHIPPIKRRLQSNGPVVIGNNVWIGDKVTILSNVQIGDNVIVAANSVVTKNIPSNSICAGVPARIIKQIEE